MFIRLNSLEKHTFWWGLLNREFCFTNWRFPLWRLEDTSEKRLRLHFLWGLGVRLVRPLFPLILNSFFFPDKWTDFSSLGHNTRFERWILNWLGDCFTTKETGFTLFSGLSSGLWKSARFGLFETLKLLLIVGTVCCFFEELFFDLIFCRWDDFLKQNYFYY